MNEESTARWYSSGDGLSLSYRRVPGPARRAPIVCIHDLAQTSRTFDPLAMDLRETRAVILPDQRGHGRSDYPVDLSRYRLEMLADDMVRLFEAERLRHLVLLGVGIGGFVAMRLAGLIPDHVAGVLLIESGPELSEAEFERIVRQSERAAAGSWTAAEQHIAGARLILGDRAGHPTCDWDGSAPPRLLHDLAAIDGWKLFEALKAKPVLAMRGAGSRLLSATTFSAMAWQKPDLTRATISEVEDCRLLTSPAAIEAVRSFLNTCP